MNTFKKRIGLFCAMVCLLVPILSRIPRGMDWVMQYFPTLLISNMDIGSIIGELLFAIIPGNIILLAFALIPPAIVYLCSLKSKTRYYLPLLFSFITTVIATAYYHHDFDYDLYTYNLAAIAFFIFPMYIAFFGGAAGVMGAVVETVIIWVEDRK